MGPFPVLMTEALQEIELGQGINLSARPGDVNKMGTLGDVLDLVSAKGKGYLKKKFTTTLFKEVPHAATKCSDS